MKEIEEWWESDNPEVKAYIEKVRREVDEEVRATDPVAQQCRRVLFVSRSKGKRRKRRLPKEVELICYRGKCVEYRDGYGPFDKWATEVLGDSVPPDEAEREFLKRVRAL